MIHVTCRLTAQNRDQLRNPTLGNRVWATFTLNTSPLNNKSHMLSDLSRPSQFAALTFGIFMDMSSPGGSDWAAA